MARMSLLLAASLVATAFAAQKCALARVNEIQSLSAKQLNSPLARAIGATRRAYEYLDRRCRRDSPYLATAQRNETMVTPGRVDGVGAPAGLAGGSTYPASTDTSRGPAYREITPKYLQDLCTGLVALRASKHDKPPICGPTTYCLGASVAAQRRNS